MIKKLTNAILELADDIRAAARARKEEFEWVRSHFAFATKHDLAQMEKRIMDALANLTTEVEETETAIDSAILLIKGLSDLIKAAGTDPVKLGQLTDRLDAKGKALAQAVVENTPAATE